MSERESRMQGGRAGGDGSHDLSIRLLLKAEDPLFFFH